MHMLKVSCPQKGLIGGALVKLSRCIFMDTFSKQSGSAWKSVGLNQESAFHMLQCADLTEPIGTLTIMLAQLNQCFEMMDATCHRHW